MNARFLLASLALACTMAPSLSAQSGIDSRCTDPALVGSNNEGQDACQKALDLLNYMTPQLGTLIAGGNATLGQGGTLGGLGTLRVGVSQRDARELRHRRRRCKIGGGAAHQLCDGSAVGGSPVVDAAFDCSKASRFRWTNVLGVISF